MNPKQKSMIIGAVLGAALGALAGYLFTRDLDPSLEGERAQELSLRSVRTGDLVKLVIAILGVLRGISELGEWT
jgi:hypothetical protein